MTTALDALGESVFLLSPDWRVLFLNRRARTWMPGGRDPIGHVIWDVFADAIGGPFWQACQRSMADRMPAETEQDDSVFGRRGDARAFPADNGGIVVSIRGSVGRRGRDDDGPATGCAISPGSTAWLRIGAAGAGSGTGMGTWAVNLETGDVDLSSDSQMLLGGVAPVLTAREWLELVHPDDRHSVLDAYTTVAAGNAQRELVFRTTAARPDGGERWLLLRGRVQERTADGTPSRVIGILLDVTARHRAEQALRETERRFEAVANAAPAMIWMADTTKACTWFNQPWLTFTGRTMEQEIGDGWTEGVHPDDFARCVATYSDAFDRRLPFRMDYRLRRADGTWRITDDTGVPRFNGDGTFLGYIGAVVDVTEAREAQAALQRLNETLENRIAERTAQLASANAELQVRIRERERAESEVRAIFEQAAVGIALMGMDGRWQQVNDKLCAITGYAREELIGHSLRDITHPDDADANLATMQGHVAERGGARVLEKRYLRKDGGVVWARVTASMQHAADGAPANFIAVLEDITERKRAEEALQQSEERFRKLFDSAPLPNFLVDLATLAIADCNDAATAMLGYDRTTLRGMSLDALDANPDPAFLTGFADRIRSEGAAQFETRYRIRSGELRDIIVAAVSLDVGGRRMALCTVIDITERRRAEVALRQAQKMEAIGNIAGGIAHDFNNILAVVIGHLELLEDEDSPAIRRDMIAEMLKAAETGAELTSRLLTFARVRPLRVEQVETASVVTSISRLLGRVLGEHIKLSLALAPDLWPILVDRAELETCLLNLATNARDAMPDGGLLHLSAANVTVGPGEGTWDPALRPGDYVALSVADTGRGMDPAVVARIFDPFFTTKGVSHGTGLGLSMAFGFVQQIGGHISVATAPGQGATFTLFIPRADGTEPLKAEDAEPGGLPRGNGETILLVEDNEALRRTIARNLTLLNYAVVEAADGPAALQALGAANVDLLLSDIALPNGLTGIALARQVRDAYPAIRILLTSGFPEAGGPGMPGRGALEFSLLAKPYRIAALAEAVRTALHREERR